MNHIILSGNLTRDPETRTTNTGKSLVRMGLAVRRPYKNPNGEYSTDFFDITAWDKTADTCAKFLKKGSRVMVEGRMEINQYEKNGVTMRAPNVIAANIEFLDSRKGDSNTPSDDYSDMPF